MAVYLGEMPDASVARVRTEAAQEAPEGQQRHARETQIKNQSHSGGRRASNKGGKASQHNFDVEAASPGCRLGLGRWFAPKGRLGLRGKGGARVCLAGHWHGSSRSHCQREVPTAGAGASCFPWFPHPHVHLAGRVSAFSTPQRTHTHTARSKPTLARPYGKRRRLNKTCRLVSVQGPGAVGGLVARRSVASTYTWACDGRRTQQSQPASQTDSDEHGNGLGEVGRWEREEGSMKQALYLSCPRNLLRAEPSLASRPRLSSSPSLHLSPSVSLRLSPPLMVSCPCHPLPSSPAGSVVERKQSERGTRGHQPALGRPRCVTGR